MRIPPPDSPTPPSSSSAAEDALIGLYTAAQTVLLAGSTDLIRRLGVSFAMPKLRRFVMRLVNELTHETGPLITAMITHESGQGHTFAGKAIGNVPPPPSGGGGGTPPGGFLHAGRDAEGEPFFDLSLDHGDRAAAAIRRDLESELADVRQRLTRLPDDIYKAIGPGGAVAQVIDNNLTGEQAQAKAWQEFIRRGVTGFTDRAGRNWQLSSYVEMAVRTSSARAFNASSIARMQAVGFRYFTVPPHVHPCPLCGPWQGAVLTIGPNPDPTVSTDGTVEEATAAGLFHPNCRDTLVAYDPRVMARPTRRVWTDEDEARYAATQKQRALERNIRAAKTAAAHGLTPEAQTAGRADVRKAQTRLRAHLAQHPQLGRQPRREQPNLGNAGRDLSPWMPPAGPRPPFSDGSAPDWTAAAAS